MRSRVQHMTSRALAGTLLVIAFWSAPRGLTAQTGTEYRITDIKVTGAKIMGSVRAIRALGLKSGAKVGDRDLEQAADALKHEYFKYGFIRVRVSANKEAHPAVDNEKYVPVSINIDVNEGRHYFITPFLPSRRVDSGTTGFREGYCEE